jgi:hypothetical protein
MNRRIDDKLRTLCTQLLALNDDNDEELHPIVVELRSALHQHSLRASGSAYQFVVERRKRSGIPPLQEQEAS